MLIGQLSGTDLQGFFVVLQFLLMFSLLTVNESDVVMNTRAMQRHGTVFQGLLKVFQGLFTFVLLGVDEAEIVMQRRLNEFLRRLALQSLMKVLQGLIVVIAGIGTKAETSVTFDLRVRVRRILFQNVFVELFGGGRRDLSEKIGEKRARLLALTKKVEHRREIFVDVFVVQGQLNDPRVVIDVEDRVDDAKDRTGTEENLFSFLVVDGLLRGVEMNERTLFLKGIITGHFQFEENTIDEITERNVIFEQFQRVLTRPIGQEEIIQRKNLT